MSVTRGRKVEGGDSTCRASAFQFYERRFDIVHVSRMAWSKGLSEQA